MKPILIYLFLLFLIPTLPDSKSIDIIGYHWFLFSVLNFFALIYLFFFKKVYFPSPRFLPFSFYTLFIISCIISLLYTNNIDLSLVDFSRILNSFLAFLIIYSLSKFSNFNFNDLSILITIFLILDLFFIFRDFFVVAYQNDISVFSLFSTNRDPVLLKGLTGNKNITAAYLLIKLPFLFYLSLNSKINFRFLLINFLLFFSLSTIFLLKSRASYLSLFAISLLFVFSAIFNSKKSLIYIPILFLSFVTVNLFNSSINTSSITSEITSIKFTNESSNSRFQLWSNAFESSVNNNFIGVGLGNWKIESLPYWNKNGSDYIVPYHAHNDFMEILAEVGPHAALFYLFLFLISFYYLFASILKTKSQIAIVIASSLIVYFVDASLNFPLERAVMQFFFVFLIFLISTRYETKLQ